MTQTRRSLARGLADTYAMGEYIPTGAVFGQSTNYSCVASSLRMALEKKAIYHLPEGDLAKALGTVEGQGASITKISEALETLRISRLKTRTFDKISFEKFADELKPNEISIVSVTIPGSGRHAIIVDSIKNGQVYIRDPLPLNTGSAYSISIKDFKDFFNEVVVIIK